MVLGPAVTWLADERGSCGVTALQGGGVLQRRVGGRHAVTYLMNNHMYMRYDQALASGWPIATGMIEGACRFVPSKTVSESPGPDGRSPDGAEVILKLRAVVVNGDLDD